MNLTLDEWLKTQRSLEDRVREARSSADRREAEEALAEFQLAYPQPQS